jgi:ArsR family transcriptional regulator
MYPDKRMKAKAPKTSPILDWMHALADATRTRILRLLERQALSVAELCAVLQMPQSTVSRHLRVLGDDQWVTSQRDRTSTMYRMRLDDLDPAARRLWLLVRDQSESLEGAASDDQRLGSVLAERQTRSQAFFASTAGQWDKLRAELFGPDLDKLALAGLADPAWTIADLGCGTGQLAGQISPFVKQVYAVDSSRPMLEAAARRLADQANVALRRGELTALPLDDQAIDLAILSLVLHHVAEPPRVLAEAARTLKAGGRLLVIDMVEHDRQNYRQSMGHVWLGFAQNQLEQWVERAGLSALHYTMLPADPAAKGPPLFSLAATRARPDPTPSNQTSPGRQARSSNA